MTRAPAREILNAFAAVMSAAEWQKMVAEYVRARQEMERAQ